MGADGGGGGRAMRSQSGIMLLLLLLVRLIIAADSTAQGDIHLEQISPDVIARVIQSERHVMTRLRSLQRRSVASVNNTYTTRLGNESSLENGVMHKVDNFTSILADIEQDLLCYVNFNFLHEYPPTEEGQIYCNSTWNTVSCWPTTLAGHTASIPCPEEFGNHRWDTTKNATRLCAENGTWVPLSNYSRCRPLKSYPEYGPDFHNFPQRIIYYVGFSLSSIALSIALFIFLYYRSLRCLRNTIHCHLIVSFILRNMLWVILNNTVLHLSDGEEKCSTTSFGWICRLIVTIYNYLTLTNFFWMFVEGLYLHTMIVLAYSADKIRFWHYVVIGWVIPGVIISIWVVVKSQYENCACWLPMKKTYYDFIYIGPSLLVLFINMIFLLTIVYVLITKLRASNSLQTRQYRKAVKATVILAPLLGVTYVLFISQPSDPTAMIIFMYCNAVLQSTQGFSVAVFYCFLNGEVRSAIKMRFSRWQDSRSVASTRWTRVSITNNESIDMQRINNAHALTSNGQNHHVASNHLTVPPPKRDSTDTNDNRKNYIREHNSSGTPMLNLDEEAV